VLLPGVLGKVLCHITSSFPKLDMCLITLAGWFSLEPVNKKFDPSSLVSIPTPPCSHPYPQLTARITFLCGQFHVELGVVKTRSEIFLPVPGRPNVTRHAHVLMERSRQIYVSGKAQGTSWGLGWTSITDLVLNIDSFHSECAEWSSEIFSHRGRFLE